MQEIQELIDTEKFVLGPEERAAITFLGGDLAWLDRLLGISTSPQVPSIYDEGILVFGEPTTVSGQDVERSAESDAAQHARYVAGTRSLLCAGCVGVPLLVLCRWRVVICVLHMTMAFGRLVCAFINEAAPDVGTPERRALQKVLDDGKTHFTVGSHSAPDGEDTARILRNWEEISELLPANAGANEAVLDLRELLRALYRTWQSDTPVGPTRCRDVARKFQEFIGGERMSYMHILEHNVDDLLRHLHPYGLGMFCCDIIESINRLLKRAYADHSNRGGGVVRPVVAEVPGVPDAHASVASHARVLLQVLQWIFMYFDVHLLVHGKPRAARCNAQAAMLKPRPTRTGLRPRRTVPRWTGTRPRTPTTTRTPAEISTYTTS